MNYITAIDFSILNFIRDYMHTSLGDILMPFVSRIANGGFIWIMIALLFMCSKKYRPYVPYLLASLCICVLWGEVILKPLVKRIRPCHIEMASMLISKPRGYSFPSGHSMSSFCAATFLWQVKRQWGIAAMILAFFIAFSRLYLYVHFPSDVLVGSIFGCLIGWGIGHMMRHKRLGSR